MIITFTSKAGPDIVMFGDVAKHLLRLIGKEATERGIITVAQLPDAVDRLKAVMARDKAARAGKHEAEIPVLETDDHGNVRDYVALSNRALPLLDLCERAQRRQTPVLWACHGD